MKKTTLPRVPVDPYKRLHFAVALAPAFVTEFFRGDTFSDYHHVAESLITLADILARRVDAQRQQEDPPTPLPRRPVTRRRA